MPKAQVTVNVIHPNGTLIDTFVVESLTDVSTPDSLTRFIRATLDNMPYITVSPEPLADR